MKVNLIAKCLVYVEQSINVSNNTSYDSTASPICMHLQVTSNQRANVFACHSAPPVPMSGIHGHTHASSTGGCAFVCTLLYRTVYSTVVHYLYFEPRMSRNRWKSSDDVAGTARGTVHCKAQDLNVGPVHKGYSSHPDYKPVLPCHL